MSKTIIETEELVEAISNLRAAAELVKTNFPHATDVAGEYTLAADKLYVKYLCKIVLTNAPVDYDYGYCVQLVPDATPPEWLAHKGPFRTVAIPKTSVQYQTARYGSGLYYAEVLP